MASRGEVICEWESGKNRYRLIARGKWTEGFRDVYLIDILTQDSLGEPSWQLRHQWARSDETAMLRLTEALESVLLQRGPK